MNKLSGYNYFVPQGSRMIYFNGISNKVFSLDRQEHGKMQMLFQNLEIFEQKYSSIFEKFQQWGFVVPENRDEVKYLLYKNKQAVFQDKNYLLIINPTLECNFSCWYCYEKHPKGKMSEETKERIIKHIKYMVEKERITALNLSWFGGEPLLYFDEIIYPISLYGKNLCEETGIPFSNSVTTNAFLIDEKMIRKMDQIELNDFQITLDGDKKKHDKVRNEKGRPSFNRIMDNINMLLARSGKVSVLIRINYDNRTLEVCDLREVFNRINVDKRKLVQIDFQRVWQTADGIKGENTTLKFWFNLCCELGYKQEGMLSVFTVGLTHKCYADRLYHCELNYDGKVYRCTARGYDDKYVLGELTEEGNIRWRKWKMSERYGRATFENEICLACKYLPLCMGPCSQKMDETACQNVQDLCYLNLIEATPEQAILDYYRCMMERFVELKSNSK